MADQYVAYVGAYTHEKSKGIHIFDLDNEKATLKERYETILNNPSFLAMSHSEKFLYSICDEGVAAYSILDNGDIELMNVESINGMRGCYISLTKDDRYMFISGYHDGKITVMHINEDGSIGSISDEVFHKGVGSIADRNFRPHVSCAIMTPDEELLCACDLGIDQIKLYEFNKNTGKIKLYDIIRSQLESAPREMIFSKDGRFAYVLCELKNYINVYAYHAQDEKNRFEFIQNIFTLRKDHRVNSAATDICLTEDGEHLLCANAGDNSVTMYRVNQEDGHLTLISSLPISGDYPKYIAFFPDGKHIMSLNHDGNTITIFSINWERGLIVMAGRDVPISKPNNIVIRKIVNKKDTAE